ncbi:MAG TPA: TldD/PmbA family protein [Candidatus Avipropionibacterium avicola]|uniref:TldD/PmbA family protein n=1 Tax=Candidatus Avipropionibacterium avicola TaxID=2840701 RepID=A0A9D1KKP4_9ACTN|nr:TldD/PmbA family protein [Candidatus Avipropionibacterium avicola]
MSTLDSTTIASSDLVEELMAASRSDECVVIVTETGQANLRWAHNALTTNGQMHDRSLSVVAIRRSDDGAHCGTVSGRITSGGDALALLRSAERAAEAAPAAEDTMDLVDACQDADFSSAAEGTSIEVLSRVAADLGEVFSQAESADLSTFGFVEHICTTTWLGTSNGIRRRHVQPTGRLELNAKDRAMKRSVWLGRATRDFSDVDVSALWPELVTRYGWTERQIELPAGRYETLLPPSAVADLMIPAHWGAGWRDASEGRNAYSLPGGRTRIGERLGTLPYRLFSDPDHPGLEASPFVVSASSSEGISSVFDNGADLDPTDWIRDGVVNELLASRSVGQVSGRGAHPEIDNLILDTGATTTLDEMVAATDRGLLLTCLWYIREVDPETLLLTGLTRDGVHLVEGGEVVGSVNNFRFNESPLDLLRRATEASRTEIVLPREWNDWFTRTAMPTLRIPDFNMSTVSRAS